MFSLRSLLRPGAGVLLLMSFLLGCGVLPASAHVRDSTGYSDIKADGGTVSYSLSLEYEMLARAVDLGPEAVVPLTTARGPACCPRARTTLRPIWRNGCRSSWTARPASLPWRTQPPLPATAFPSPAST